MTTRNVVYTTGLGRRCPECGQPVPLCKCARSKPATPPAANPGDGIVRVGRQTKGRGGKAVSIITGLPLTPAALHAMAAQLKKRCGSGGTVRGEAIEIQGEHRDTLVVELERLGYKVRKSGG